MLEKFNLKELRKVYQSTTITIGTTEASQKATQCLSMIHNDCKNIKKGKILTEKFYVDNILLTTNT
jgi:hypothetical protein